MYYSLDQKKQAQKTNCNGKQLLCTAANEMLNRQKMSNLEHVIINYEHQKEINLFNNSQVNYLRGTALNISSSAYSNLFSNEYATSKK
jgi:hypothetical protein